MIDTQCPVCKTPLTDKDADVEKGILQCPSCHEELSLLEASLKIEDKSYKNELPSVEGVEVQEGKDLNINITPKASGEKWLPLIFGAILTGAPILIHFFGELNFKKDFPLYIILFIFFTIGLLMLATVFKRLFMYTRISVDQEKVLFQYSLFGWLPIAFKNIKADQILQFFANEFREGKKSDKPVVSYKVKASIKGKGHITLVSGLREPASAFYVEEQLERYLQIEDRVVPGEFLPDHKPAKARTDDEYWVVLNMASQNKSYVFVNCKSCGLPLEDASFDIDANLIQCQKCKSLEKLDTTVFSAENAEAWLKKEKADALPRNITIEEGIGMDIKIKHPFHVGGFQVWGLIVCAFLLYDRYYIPGGSLPFEDIRIRYLVYLLAFLWGAWSMYSIIKRISFKTIIEVRSTHIKIYDYFLNQFKQNGAQLNRSEFDQLFVEEQEIIRGENNVIKRFNVFARLKDGKKYFIMEELPKLEQAHYLEHKIESFLDIEDEIIDQSYQPDFKKRAAAPRNLMEVYKLFKEYPKRMY
jgi:DNA-directed RNA polymerase subunit M/transcription elongation factor TFIIS